MVTVAETRTLTPAERVNLLLDENQRLRDELNAMDVSHQAQLAALDGAFRREELEKGLAYEARIRHLEGEGSTDATLDVVRASNKRLREKVDAFEAANDALRAALRKAEQERVDAQVIQYAAEAECEQLRRELAQARGRHSRSYTVGQLVGVCIGAAVVGLSVGCGVATEVLRGWPW